MTLNSSLLTFDFVTLHSLLYPLSSPEFEWKFEAVPPLLQLGAGSSRGGPPLPRLAFWLRRQFPLVLTERLGAAA